MHVIAGFILLEYLVQRCVREGLQLLPTLASATQIHGVPAVVFAFMPRAADCASSLFVERALASQNGEPHVSRAPCKGTVSLEDSDL